VKEGKQFFFEKKNQKTFAHGARRPEPDPVMAGLDPAIHAAAPPRTPAAHKPRPPHRQTKVFCFFFSKKKPSFPLHLQ
jgi:hypothetical protein